MTHDFEDVWALANRVIVVRKGEVIQEGDPESVFRRPSPDFVAEFLGTNVIKARVKGLEGKLTALETENLKYIPQIPPNPEKTSMYPSALKR